jgi:IS1 family transposase
MNVLPLDKQIAVISALTEGMSIRSVERLTGIHRDTIMRLGVRVGLGCDRLHDYYFRDLNVATIELDELWAFIGKKQKRRKPEDVGKGDAYTYLALDATNKAILAHRTGKRDYETTEFFLNDLRSRVMGSPYISSDAFRYYEKAVERTFGRRTHYGQIIKHFSGEPSMEAQRRYSPGVVVAVDKRVIRGRIEPDEICTSHVERANLSVRMASRRFTRLTNGFSKKIENHRAAVGLYVAHYNLCRVHETLRTTPAMALGVTDHVWSIADLIEGALYGSAEPRGRKVRRFRVIDGGAT